MTGDSFDRWMHLALSLGRRGQGQTWPNPSVGCVIVNDGRLVGRGWTQPGGRPHAEPIALAQAGDAARGATAFVTLEPCAHTGKTGPCALALVQAGVSRVVIATVDPDPRVAGKGIKILQDAGIDVVTGVGKDAADRDHAGFFKRLGQGRPRVTLKLALSMDGRIATSTGHSQWITGPASRRHVHADRLRHDAVMVGGGTARADDPALTVRGLGDVRQPVRVIMSQKLDFAGDALANGLPDAPVFLIHGPKAPKGLRQRWLDEGAELFEVSTDGGGLAATAALQALGNAGLTSVYCEGGGTLAASLLRADLVDDVVLYGAGLAIGADGISALGAMGLTDLKFCPRFTLQDLRHIGGDVRQHWTRPN